MQFVRDETKNQIIQNRTGWMGISFEEVEEAIRNGWLLADKPHPKEDKYPWQRIMIIEAKGYTYVVPYIVIDKDNIYLITAYPSRKAQKNYL